MGNPVTYPDGTTLYSSAITVQEMGQILQPVTLGMLGQEVSPSSSFVRIGWPTEGQPFINSPSTDVCYLRFVPKDEPYDKIRDRVNFVPLGWGQGEYPGQPYGGTESGSPALTEGWAYTRVWEIFWVLYGPNAVDNTRAIRSGLFQDYFLNLLQQSQLYPMSSFTQPVRVPELIDAMWVDRSDFSCEMYEFVTETIIRQTVESVEVILENAGGTIADFTVTSD
jgi:hypothetical protein